MSDYFLQNNCKPQQIIICLVQFIIDVSCLSFWAHWKETYGNNWSRAFSTTSESAKRIRLLLLKAFIFLARRAVQ